MTACFNRATRGIVLHLIWLLEVQLLTTSLFHYAWRRLCLW